MEIAKSVSDGLALLGEPAFDDAAFKRLALAAFQAVSSPGQLRTAEEAKALAERFAAETALPAAGGGLSPAQVKELFAALVTAVLEAAKHNAAPKDFVNVLEESKVPAERVKLLARAYEERHEAVRAVLSQINFGFAQVVGVTWRLDQLVSSDALGAIKKPVYFVTLKTQQPDGSLRDVEFTCSLQGLQDLVAKLRDACKQVERILQPAKK